MKRLAFLLCLTLPLGATAAARPTPCVSADGRCLCVSGAESLAQFARRFARGEMDGSVMQRGVFLEATTLRVSYVDSLGALLPRFRHLNDRRAQDFSVGRTWRRPGSVAPPDTVRFYTPAFSACPLPGWAVGKTYLIFAYPAADTLRALAPCAVTFPVDSAEARQAIAVLDSLRRAGRSRAALSNETLQPTERPASGVVPVRPVVPPPPRRP